MPELAASFDGSIPEYYDRIMGRAQFDRYGQDLARRVPAHPLGSVLELACGTGILTRHLRERLGPTVRLVATDLSEAMLSYARSKVGGVIEWRAADAGRLPFADAEFGIAVCAFGVMFFPDKKAAFREARRVLREGGGFYFNVWDGLHGNPHARVAADFLASLFPGDPAMKFGSMPYAFNDEALIRQMLGDARFGHIRTERVSFACSCPSAKEWATGQIRGTPRGLLLQERGLSLDEVIDRLAQTMARVGGTAPFEYTPQALLIEARSV